jgi:peptidoglycan/LPS O-acetylase OafA/YrhL
MKQRIPDGLSVYLDLVRFIAASVVVLHHTWPLVIPRFPLPWPGHSAVVVFFVLSGYVIAHASRPEQGFREYAYRRMARVMPVTSAALLLSAVIAPIAGLNEVPNGGSMLFKWQNLWTNFIFLGQSWADVAPPYNPPYWSLNYEIWYYIIFGAWAYFPNRWITIAAVIIAGPKIMLLFPVWLTGVFIYKKMPKLEASCALQLFFATMVFGLILVWFDVAVHIREYMKVAWPSVMRFTGGSGMFVGDFLLGIAVALNFIAAANLEMTPVLRHEALIRKFSGFTFSTYLFHMPLTILIWNGFDIHTFYLYYPLLATGIFALGQITEQKTGFYQALLQRWAPSRKRVGAQSVS